MIPCLHGKKLHGPIKEKVLHWTDSHILPNGMTNILILLKKDWLASRLIIVLLVKTLLISLCLKDSNLKKFG